MKNRSLEKIALPWRILLAVAASALFALTLSLIASWIAFHSASPTGRVGAFGAAVYLLTLFFCAFLGAKVTAENRFLGGISAGAICWLLLVCGSFFTAGGFLHTALWSLIGFAVIAAGALLGAKEKARRCRRHR